MDKKKLQTLKKKLEEEKQLLETELGSVSKKNTQVEGDWVATVEGDSEIELGDNAVRQQAMMEHGAIANTLEARLFNVNLALEKIEKGTYGICEKTGKPIEMERLEVNPAARTCTFHFEE